jgi:hypothetical protein
MSFLAPLMLFGGAAIGIPIALHFFYKARHRPLPWAAMEFLRQSIEQTSKRLRFQELVLLILRCLVLLFLALALARLSCRWGASSGRGETVDAVFVFDNSYSMGAQDGDKTRFERAQEAALGVIDNLPPRSTVQVITCSDRATAIKFTPSNLDQARQVVKSIELTSLSGDMLPGLNEAYNALDRGVGSNKEIYVFSDMQKNGWERQAAAVKAKAAEIQPRAPLILVRSGREDVVPSNISITDITFPGGIPHTGTRMPFTVHLKNTGKTAVANVAVTLEVDGEKQDIDTAFAPRIEPGTSFPVTLTGKLTKPGDRLITAKIGQRKGEGAEATATQPDELPGDNRFDKLIPVRDRIRVLLVDGSLDTGDAAKTSTFYMRNALLPTTESARENYFVRVSEVKPDLLSPQLLADTDICMLCNVASASSDRAGIPGLPPEFVERLVEFVKNGGGLVIGSGDFVAADKYNAVLGSRGLLPFPLEAPESATKDMPNHPAPDTAESPSFLSQFREVPFSIVTANVNVFTTMGTKEADRSGGGHVLLRLDNNKPLITAKALGEGEVIFVTTSLDETWTNWPVSGESGTSYLSLIQKTLSHLTGRATSGTNRIAGEPLQWAPPTASSKGFELVRPNRTRVHLGLATGGDKSHLMVTTSDDLVAGEYQMGIEGETTPTGPRFAVIPDLRESENLEAMSDTEFEQAVGFKPVIVSAGAEAQQTVGNLRSKREWTIYLLLLVFVFAGLECAWAWYCGRAK